MDPGFWSNRSTTNSLSWNMIFFLFVPSLPLYGFISLSLFTASQLLYTFRLENCQPVWHSFFWIIISLHNYQSMTVGFDGNYALRPALGLSDSPNIFCLFVLTLKRLNCLLRHSLLTGVKDARFQDLLNGQQATYCHIFWGSKEDW